MLFSSFLRSLDEERLDGDGNSESTLFLTYMTVGDEAAFHLGGFFVDDAAGMVFTEMQYLDRRLKRFQTIIDLWEMELAWDQEDRA
ncbi:hypothetical protein CCR84_05985 [Rhodocyclus purpureus]|nr:hypothetical protein [Rhodocyclus purpureus]